MEIGRTIEIKCWGMWYYCVVINIHGGDSKLNGIYAWFWGESSERILRGLFPWDEIKEIRVV